MPNKVGVEYHRVEHTHCSPPVNIIAGRRRPPLVASSDHQGRGRVGIDIVGVGRRGGRGTAPFLRVAPLSYPQPGLQRVRDDDDDRDDDDGGGGGGGGGGASTTATSWAILAHAWLSASLTDAFASPNHRRDNGGGGDDDWGDEVGRRPKQLPPPPSPGSGCCGGSCGGGGGGSGSGVGVGCGGGDGGSGDSSYGGRWWGR